MRCRVCNRPLTDPVQIKKGIGPECEKKERAIQNGTAKPLIILSSKTKVFRTYFYIIGSQKIWVRIFPDELGRTARCFAGCEDKCQHIIAVAEVDTKFFPQIAH